MLVLVYFLGLILGIISIFKVVLLLVQQYYSFSRLMGVFYHSFRDNLKNNISALIFIFSGIILIFYDFNYFAYIIILLCCYFILPDVSLKRYSFTRRNILLLSFSIIFYLSCYTILYKININIPTIGLLGLILISVVISYWLLWPLEFHIKRHYILKAKHKLSSKNRIIIGITGSFGKTTMKNLIYSFLHIKYLISHQNHNYNTVNGLCKYINNELNDDDEIVIVELGVDHPHSMKKFKQIFELDYAIITSIGEMHLSTFHNLDNIAKEKLEIISLLKEDGKLYVSEQVFNDYKNQIKYPYEVYSSKDLLIDQYGVINFNNKKIDTKLLSFYQFVSLSGAYKISLELGLNNNELEYGFSHLNIPSRRLQIIKKEKYTLIDDSYNANINGIKEALNVLKRFDGKKIVITGGLIEIKDKYDSYNRNIAKDMLFCDQIIALSLDNKHRLCDEIIKFGFQEKLLHLDVASLKIYLENCENATVLLLAKGNDFYLK